MRIKIMFACLGVILLAFNYGIYQNEQIKKEGEIVLLPLVPVDPRSLMQGDYMILRYALVEESRQYEIPHNSQYIVIELDENKVAHFVRFYDEKPLLAKEKIFPFYGRPPICIRPESFLFQEGYAKYYENAKYGVFKLNDLGKCLLIGLADEKGQIIAIPPTM